MTLQRPEHHHRRRRHHRHGQRRRPTDDVHIDAGSVSATITGASGGNFESLAINPAAAVTSVTDTIDKHDRHRRPYGESGSVNEGTPITYTVTVPNAVTGSPVNGHAGQRRTITIGIGATSGSVTTTPADNAYAGSSTVTNSIASISGGNFEHLVAAAAATVRPPSRDEPVADVTTVSLSATPSVAEGGSIGSHRHVTNAGGAQTPVTVTPPTARASPSAPAPPPARSASPPPHRRRLITYIDAAGRSAPPSPAPAAVTSESLAINPAAAVTSVTDTIDTVTAVLTASGSVNEGTPITYTVTLPNAVTGSPVTVTLANGEVITIGIGATSGSVTTTPADNVYAGSSTVTNSIASISGGNWANTWLPAAPPSAPPSRTNRRRRHHGQPVGDAERRRRRLASFTPPRSPTPHRPRSP